ncbi:MAG: trehalose-6-phosphate synthase [Phycisphaerae bacterium]|nr:trehalose-6-phosphate synthase [Phycisphaerae bacterium]
MIVVANRLPAKRVRKGRSWVWETSPGGLVSALHPLLRERGGAWVGWDGTSGGRAVKPFDHDGFRIHPVHVTKDELDKFYAGFSNRTLWPLYHDALRAPEFHRRWWWPYVEVNQRYADAAIGIMGKKDTVWVQDYQLQLAPAMIRAKRPGARIGFFLHTPFPPEELFAKMPWRRQVLEGLLGADVIGFQDKLSAMNFIRTAQRFTAAKRHEQGLLYNGRTVIADAFPISIDVSRYQDLAMDPEIVVASERFRAAWDHRPIILGVDRLDYTKGIDIRLRAFEEVLRRGTISAKDAVMIQIAVPTRQSVDDYAELRDTVEQYVGRINGTYAMTDFIAVHYVYRSLPIRELIACYLAADVMMVTPFRDGMNLVAKEYVVTRTRDTGVLVLSEFAGAASELNDALLVNPHDIDGMANMIEHALELDAAERKKRMRALRKRVESHTVHDWSDSFMTRLAGE